MSPDEPRVRRFIRRSMTARIATVSPRGTPQVMALWFMLKGGRIYMNNAATSPTARNIAAGSPVVLLFDADRGDERGRCLRVTGTARYIIDDRLLRNVAMRALPKYYLSFGALRTALRHLNRLSAMRRYYAERGGGSGVIEVTPETAEFIEHPA